MSKRITLLLAPSSNITVPPYVFMGAHVLIPRPTKLGRRISRSMQYGRSNLKLGMHSHSAVDSSRGQWQGPSCNNSVLLLTTTFIVDDLLEYSGHCGGKQSLLLRGLLSYVASGADPSN